MGSIDTLAQHFVATRQNDVFMVGLDLADLSMPAGAAMLFSGDDEFYSQISERFPATSLSDLATVFHAAGRRIEAMNRSPGRRAIPRDVPQEISDMDLGKHLGLAARREPFAIIRTSREVGNESLFHLMMMDKNGSWRSIFQATTWWIHRLAAVTEDAGRCLSQPITAQIAPG